MDASETILDAHNFIVGPASISADGEMETALNIIKRLLAVIDTNKAEIRRKTAVEAFKLAQEWERNPKMLDALMHHFGIFFDIYPNN